MSSIMQIQSKDEILRINDTDALPAITSFSWDGQMNAEQLGQLGNPNFDAQIVQPSVTTNFEVRTTGMTASQINRMTFSYNQSTGEYVPPAGTSNDRLVRETDFERSVFDVISAKRANDRFDRSYLIPRCHLSSVSFSASTEGQATESFAAEADVLEVHRRDTSGANLGTHDIRSVPCPRNATNASTTIKIGLDGTYRVEPFDAVEAGAAWKIRYIDVDGVRIAATDANIDIATGSGGNPDTVTLTAAAQAAGFEFPLGARVHAVLFRKSQAGAFPEINIAPGINSNYRTTARFQKADTINLYLIAPGSAAGTAIKAATTATAQNAVTISNADLLLRVQSFDMTIPVERDALREIRQNTRGTSVYHRAARYPLTITANASILEHNLSEWAKLQGRESTVSPALLDLAGFETPTWILCARYAVGGQVVQTLALTDARVSGLGQQQSVGGRSETSFAFTGSQVYLAGAEV